MIEVDKEELLDWLDRVQELYKAHCIIEPQSPDQEALASNNYTANLDKDDQELYIPPKSHRHIKFWSFLILVIFIVALGGYRSYSNIFESN